MLDTFPNNTHRSSWDLIPAASTHHAFKKKKRLTTSQNAGTVMETRNVNTAERIRADHTTEGRKGGGGVTLLEFLLMI